jgi:hypothetical protein
MDLVASQPSDFRNKLLVQEYQRLCSDIRGIESGNEKLLGLGFTLISLAAAGGVRADVNEVFFLLPIAVVGVFAYVAVSYNSLYAMGGYKQMIEEILNAAAGETVLVWERIAAVKEGRNANAVVLIAIYILVAASIIGLSVYRVAAAWNLFAAVGLSALIGVLLAGFVVGMSQMRGTKRWAQAYAHRLHDLVGTDQLTDGPIPSSA